jgi:hypothetical protein
MNRLSPYFRFAITFIVLAVLAFLYGTQAGAAPSDDLVQTYIYTDDGVKLIYARPKGGDDAVVCFAVGNTLPAATCYRVDSVQDERLVHLKPFQTTLLPIGKDT